MKKEWFYLDELCNFCNEQMLSILPPHEIDNLKFCCKECGNDHEKSKSSYTNTKSVHRMTLKAN